MFGIQLLRCFELGGEDEKTGTDAERSLECHKRGAHGHQFCSPSKMGTVERDSTAYFGGKNRVDLGQLRQVLGYEGTVEQ